MKTGKKIGLGILIAVMFILLAASFVLLSAIDVLSFHAVVGFCVIEFVVFFAALGAYIQGPECIVWTGPSRSGGPIFPF